MIRLRLPLLLLLPGLLLAGVSAAPPEDGWRRLDRVAQETVDQGNVPGVVLLVGHRGRVVYRKAFGNRELEPVRVPMTVDTVFDMASLTKVVATTSSVMVLIQDGRLRLSDRVSAIWPEFGANGKERVTIRQLLTHSSGLPAFVNYNRQFGNPDGPNIQELTPRVLQAIADIRPTYPADTRMVYSDLGFITLGEIVRRVSGQPLDRFARERVFEPLGMKETGYNPPPALRPRVAPTTRRRGEFLRGDVHDPNAQVLGGVAGHAGLFSTADDLARFARMLLSSDRKDSRRYPLSPATVREMTSPQSPPGIPVRGLGWDIDSGYSHVRGDLMPLGSFGHTGFTGTFMWVDPYSETFLIGLSNRVHPNEGGNPLGMWARASNVVAGLVRPQLLPRRAPVTRSAPVLTGLDVLERDGFRVLQGRRVGLITNRTGHNRSRVSTIDLLHRAPGVRLVALFSPEHGLRADRDEYIPSSTDEKTGLPVHSLYGRGNYKPKPEQLQGIDTLVFDIQDVGVRYYTYSSTLGLCMEAAAENRLRFVVLDRPNPINGVTVDGPMLDPARKSFIAYGPVAVRHGMTVGELAQLYNGELKLGCDLQVIQMEGWRRRMWWDETGLPWTNPSPNIRDPRQAELYCGIGLTESANISVGRGTDTPFERLGAPWIDGNRLAAELNRRRLPGLRFVPVVFTPASREFAGQACEGVHIRLHDRDAFEGCRTAVEILDALLTLYPTELKLNNTGGLFGADSVPQALLARRPVEEIVAGYREQAEAFARLRQKYLLYR